MSTTSAYRRAAARISPRLSPSSLASISNEMEMATLPDVPPSAPATRRIAARNEETLGGIGVEGLRALFDSEVIMCPVNPRYP